MAESAKNDARKSQLTNLLQRLSEFMSRGSSPPRRDKTEDRKDTLGNSVETCIASGTDLCNVDPPTLPNDTLFEIGKLLPPQPFIFFKLMSKSMHEYFDKEDIWLLMFLRLHYGHNLDSRLLQYALELSPEDMLVETLAQLPNMNDRKVVSCKDLFQQTSSRDSCWKMNRLKEPIPLQLFKSGDHFKNHVKTFKFHPQSQCHLFHYKTSTGYLVYVHNTQTDEWWCRGFGTRARDVFLDCTETQLVRSSNDSGYLTVKFWDFVDSKKELRIPPNPFSFDDNEYWYRVDNIDRTRLHGCRSSLDLFNYRGEIHIPSHSSKRLHLTIVSLCLFITTCSSTQTTVQMFDITTLDSLGTVKEFHGFVEPLFLDSKWGIFVGKSDQRFKFEIWDRVKNTWFHEEVSLILEDRFSPKHKWKFCYYDHPSDVLAFANYQYLFAVEGFAKEVITGETRLSDSIQYINLGPAGSRSKISRGCFADGRVVVALIHHYDNETSSRYQHFTHYVECPKHIKLGSVLSIDLRKWRDGVVDSSGFQIRKLPIPPAKILSMDMDWNRLYLNTYSGFFDNKNVEMIKMCKMLTRQSLTFLGEFGIQWKKCDGTSSLAYQVIQPKSSSKQQQRIHMSTFSTLASTIQEMPATGIYSYKFGE